MATSSSICFIFAIVMPFLTLNLVKEKEKRIKEAMFMMGLRSSVYWIAWFLTEGLIVFVLSLIISTMFSLLKIISNFFVNFLLIFLFSLTLIELAALLSMFFNREVVRLLNNCQSIQQNYISLNRRPQSFVKSYSYSQWHPFRSYI